MFPMIKGHDLFQFVQINSNDLVHLISFIKGKSSYEFICKYLMNFKIFFNLNGDIIT